MNDERRRLRRTRSSVVHLRSVPDPPQEPEGPGEPGDGDVPARDDGSALPAGPTRATVYSLAWASPARRARESVHDPERAERLTHALDALALDPFPRHAVRDGDGTDPLLLKAALARGVVAHYRVGPQSGYVLILGLDIVG